MRIKKYLPIVLLGLLMPFSGCSNGIPEAAGKPEYKTNLPEDTVALDAFKELFPLHYASYMENKESSKMTRYKGSVPFHKNDTTSPLPVGFEHGQPYLKNLWLGYAFMYEYNEARGHPYAVMDVLDIDRIDHYSEKGGLPATCWTCKTPKMMQWYKEYGDDFWRKDVRELVSQVDPLQDSITCATCHDPTNMKLRVTVIPAVDWLTSQGKDPNKLSRVDALNFACAQCHVEYYFNKPNMGVAQKPVFPWKNGFTPEDMYVYYETLTKNDEKVTPGFPTQFYDWIHPVSKAPMLKAQHSEYSTFITSAHGQANVTCVDCHMPYTQLSNGQKMTSHVWTSPLKDPNMTACRQCHQQDPEYLRNRVYATQDKTYQLLLQAQALSVKAHQAIRYALDFQGANQELIIKAQHAVRKGQWFWDMVSCEGGMGFHNPQQALDTLAKSLQESQKAIDYSLQAVNFDKTIATNLAKPIEELVPPIKDLNRKLAQDPQYMQSNPWLKYLPVLPKQDTVWKKWSEEHPEKA